MTAEERVKDIIQGIVHLDDTYVLDEKYIRRRVEGGRYEKLRDV